MDLIDILGIIFIITGGLFFVSPKAHNPKIRNYGIFSYTISNIILIIYSIPIGADLVFITQIILFVLNIYGLITNFIKIRKTKKENLQ